MDYSFAFISYDLWLGFIETLKVFGMTLLTALPLGLVLAFGSMSRFIILSLLVKTFVWMIRGTPLMLQLLVVYYGPGLMFELPLLPVDLAVYITFTINYSCYFSEIYRGGIESIPKGQYEAGMVLGLKKTEIFIHIIFMQMVKQILPPISNEIITLVKDTSIARIITYYEIMFKAQSYIKSSGIIWPLFYTGVYYLAFCGILTLFFHWFEKKLDYYNV